MYTKRILIIIICSLLFFKTNAQVERPATEADIKSLELFTAGQWKELMNYAKEKISSGIDFPLLRMRGGYAAFMLKKYSFSLQQYQKVWNADTTNGTALYYIYLNNVYLNNSIAAKFYAQKLPEETKETEQIKGTKLSGLQMEFSQKMPDDTARRNAHYARLGVTVDLGYRFQLQTSVAYYTLLVNTIAPNGRVTYPRLNQPEYYAKLTYAVNGKLSLLGAYHFVSDIFPNLTLNTNIFFGGIKYSTPYINLQADASTGNFAVNYSQYDGIITLYPLGNLNVYSISRVNFGSQTNFTQVLGAKLAKSTWLEGNLTTGRADYIFDNDALYVKNDQDPVLFRCGGSVYTVLSKKMMLTLNYIFEQKEFNIRKTNFYQHSINGGLSWKF